MRVVKEFSVEHFRVSIFSWNEKYLVKIEAGPFEQTYKINEYDVYGEEDFVAKITDPEFLKKVEKRFDDMASDWRELMD